MTDFPTLSMDHLVEMVCSHVGDFEDEDTKKHLTRESILREVSQGKAVVEAREHAIAVLRPEGWRSDNGNAVMWLLYVAKEARGQGIGKAFVLELRTKYERDLPMVLICNGSTRQAFFQSCGFRIKEHTNDKAVMVSDMSGT